MKHTTITAHNHRPAGLPWAELTMGSKEAPGSVADWVKAEGSAEGCWVGGVAGCVAGCVTCCCCVGFTAWVAGVDGVGVTVGPTVGGTIGTVKQKKNETRLTEEVVMFYTGVEDCHLDAFNISRTDRTADSLYLQRCAKAYNENSKRHEMRDRATSCKYALIWKLLVDIVHTSIVDFSRGKGKSPKIVLSTVGIISKRGCAVGHPASADVTTNNGTFVCGVHGSISQHQRDVTVVDYMKKRLRERS